VTTEGPTPLDMTEAKHAMAGVAELSRAFYNELRGQGFCDQDALRLTQSWIKATVQGGSRGDS